MPGSLAYAGQVTRGGMWRAVLFIAVATAVGSLAVSSNRGNAASRHKTLSGSLLLITFQNAIIFTERGNECFDPRISYEC
jgi:hypothetical protein